MARVDAEPNWSIGIASTWSGGCDDRLTPKTVSTRRLERGVFTRNAVLSCFWWAEAEKIAFEPR